VNTNQQQPLQPGQIPLSPGLARQVWDNAGRIAPGVTTTTVLGLARIWNATGAEHSVGDAALMIALSGGAAAAGWASSRGLNGEPLITATAWTASGALAVVACAAYSDGMALPLILWVLATAGVYTLAARHWREDRRTRQAAASEYALRNMERRHDLAIEETRADSQIRVAEENVAYANALADAIAARHLLDPETAADAAEIIKQSTPRPAHLRRVV
jgi:hypothetical protein